MSPLSSYLNRTYAFLLSAFLCTNTLSAWAHKVIYKKRSPDTPQADCRIILSQGDLSSCLRLPHTCPLLSSSSSIKRCSVEACGCKETGTRGCFCVAGGGEKYLSTFIFFLSLYTTFCRDRSIHDSLMCVQSELWKIIWGGNMHEKGEGDWWGDDEKEDILEDTMSTADICADFQ